MISPLSFSVAAPDDLPAIEELVHAAYTPYIERIGRKPAPMHADYSTAIEEERMMLAHSDGALVGVLVTVPAPDHLLLENVSVDPVRQGEGIGGELLELAEGIARDAGL